MCIVNDNLYLRNLFSDSDYSHPLSKIPISIEEAVNVLVAKDRNSLFMKYYAWHDNDEGQQQKAFLCLLLINENVNSKHRRKHRRCLKASYDP